MYHGWHCLRGGVTTPLRHISVTLARLRCGVVWPLPHIFVTSLLRSGVVWPGEGLISASRAAPERENRTTAGQRWTFRPHKMMWFSPPSCKSKSSSKSCYQRRDWSPLAPCCVQLERIPFLRRRTLTRDAKRGKHVLSMLQRILPE